MCARDRDQKYVLYFTNLHLKRPSFDDYKLEDWFHKIGLSHIHKFADKKTVYNEVYMYHYMENCENQKVKLRVGPHTKLIVRIQSYQENFQFIIF